MRKYLCAALAPQTRENVCALRSRRKHAKTSAHCALAANLQKAPAHRRVPFVRSSPCVIAPSRSPYFGHFAKALQNVSKVRCSLVWAIMNSSAETLAVLAARRRMYIYGRASYLYGARFRRLQHIYNMTRGFIRLHAGDRKLGIAPAPVQWEAHPIKPCERHCLTDRPAVRR